MVVIQRPDRRRHRAESCTKSNTNQSEWRKGDRFLCSRVSSFSCSWAVTKNWRDCTDIYPLPAIHSDFCCCLAYFHRSSANRPPHEEKEDEMNWFRSKRLFCIWITAFCLSFSASCNDMLLVPSVSLPLRLERDGTDTMRGTIDQLHVN